MLKEELGELKRERSKLASQLEEVRKELGSVRQNNIIQQMLGSQLLKQAESENVETESVQGRSAV